MKELTIEDKAKAYDEAFRIAQELYNNPNSSNIGKGYVCTVFPELKESEDEKIRNEIILYIGAKDDISLNTHNKWLSWLEKQGEKPQGKSALEAIKEEKVDSQNCVKTADNVEPKFNNGNWIIHQGTENIYQVVAIIDNQYQLKYGDNYTVQKCADVDRCARLWNVAKDAKDGDVLATKNAVFIFKHIDKTGLSLCKSYCEVIDNSELGLGFDFSINGVNPATKKQRDTLEKAMSNAGYEWDAEKKELKKIEQKPAWSEEDRNHFNNIIQELKNQYDRPINASYKEKIISDIDWFKSIKYRIQPKQEWSEEDEKEVAVLEAYIRSKDWSDRHIDRALGIVDELVKKLKSLKERYTWKPSDEQMKALHALCTHNSYLHLQEGL